jgi:hypothetical protein
MLKLPEREAGLSFLPSVKIKDVWSCTIPGTSLWSDV